MSGENLGARCGVGAAPVRLAGGLNWEGATRDRRRRLARFGRGAPHPLQKPR